MPANTAAKNPIVWFEIYVSNMDRARKFYETVFEFKTTNMPFSEGEMWGFPSNPEKWGCSGSLVYMKGFNPKDSGTNNTTLVYFSSPDCAVEEKRVVACGGRIQRPKMSIGQYGFISLAFDTEGNMFGIHSMQ